MSSNVIRCESFSNNFIAEYCVDVDLNTERRGRGKVYKH